MSLSPKVIEILKASTVKPSVADAIAAELDSAARATHFAQDGGSLGWASCAFYASLKLAAIELAEVFCDGNSEDCMKKAAAYRAVREMKP